MKKLFTILCSALFLLLLSNCADAQNNFGIGIRAGGGTIGGNLPSIGSFNSSFFLEGSTGFTGSVLFRLSLDYAVNIDVLLPQNSSRYIPFVRSISLTGIISQPVGSKLYVEEGLGVTVVNDRTFGNLNEWDTGLTFSILPGLDFRNDSGQGFKIGVGTEYNLTFTNTNVWFLSLYLQSEYYF